MSGSEQRLLSTLVLLLVAGCASSGPITTTAHARSAAAAATVVRPDDQGSPDCLAHFPAGALITGALRPNDQVVAAITCQATPGREPLVRHLTGQKLQALGAALRLHSKPAPSICDATGRVTPDFVVQLSDGHWVNPDLPIDGCHLSDQLLKALHG